DTTGTTGYTICPDHDAGWSSLVARRAHNPEVAGSNPAPATSATRREPGSAGPRGDDAGTTSASASSRALRRQPRRERRGTRDGRGCVVVLPGQGGRKVGVTRVRRLDLFPPARYRRAGFSWPPSRGQRCGRVAQMVEHATENRGVGGSIPSPAMWRLRSVGP